MASAARSAARGTLFGGSPKCGTCSVVRRGRALRTSVCAVEGCNICVESHAAPTDAFCARRQLCAAAWRSGAASLSRDARGSRATSAARNRARWWSSFGSAPPPVRALCVTRAGPSLRRLSLEAASEFGLSRSDSPHLSSRTLSHRCALPLCHRPRSVCLGTCVPKPLRLRAEWWHAGGMRPPRRSFPPAARRGCGRRTVRRRGSFGAGRGDAW